MTFALVESAEELDILQPRIVHVCAEKVDGEVERMSYDKDGHGYYPAVPAAAEEGVDYKVGEHIDDVAYNARGKSQTEKPRIREQIADYVNGAVDVTEGAGDHFERIFLTGGAAEDNHGEARYRDVHTDVARHPYPFRHGVGVDRSEENGKRGEKKGKPYEYHHPTELVEYTAPDLFRLDLVDTFQGEARSHLKDSHRERKQEHFKRLVHRVEPGKLIEEGAFFESDAEPTAEQCSPYHRGNAAKPEHYQHSAAVLDGFEDFNYKETG